MSCRWDCQPAGVTPRPAKRRAVVAKAYRARDVYSGEALTSAPDIIVGWNTGYRSSWQTALGAVPGSTSRTTRRVARRSLHRRTSRPRRFLSNLKPRHRDLRLEDLTVTLLHEYGVAPGSGMTGRPAF